MPLQDEWTRHKRERHLENRLQILPFCFGILDEQHCRIARQAQEPPPKQILWDFHLSNARRRISILWSCVMRLQRGFAMQRALGQFRAARAAPALSVTGLAVRRAPLLAAMAASSQASHLHQVLKLRKAHHFSITVALDYSRDAHH